CGYFGNISFFYFCNIAFIYIGPYPYIADIANGKQVVAIVCSYKTTGIYFLLHYITAHGRGNDVYAIGRGMSTTVNSNGLFYFVSCINRLAVVFFGFQVFSLAGNTIFIQGGGI